MKQFVQINLNSLGEWGNLENKTELFFNVDEDFFNVLVEAGKREEQTRLSRQLLSLSDWVSSIQIKLDDVHYGELGWIDITYDNRFHCYQAEVKSYRFIFSDEEIERIRLKKFDRYNLTFRYK